MVAPAVLPVTRVPVGCSPRGRSAARWGGAAWLVTVALLASGLSLTGSTAALAAAVPAVVPQPVTKTGSAAGALAAARASGHRVEITDEHTESGQTWANPDGSRTSALSAVPRFFRDAQGVWQDVDLTATVQGDGSIAPAATGRPVSIPARADGALHLWTSAGTVTVTHPGASAVAGSVAGSVVTYPGALGGADLVEQFLIGGVEESVVLPTASTPRSYTAVLTMPAGVNVSNAGGGVEFRDGAGALLGGFGGGRAFDAAGAEAAVTVSVAAQVGQAVTVLIATDPSWLAAPARSWPVTIDPIYQTNTAASGTTDGYVLSGADAANSYGTAGELRVGYGFGASGTEVARALIKFNLGAAPAANVVVSEAHLRIDNFASSSCIATPVALSGLAGSFTTGTTWNNQPAADAAGVVSTTTFAYGQSSCLRQWVNLDATGLAKRWFNLSQSNFGFRLQSNELGSGGWKKFNSGETGSNSAPALFVTYNHRPGTVVDQTRSSTPSGPCTIGTGRPSLASRTPVLTGASSDQDGGTTKLRFEVWPLSGTSALASGYSPFVAQGTAASWTTSTALTDGSSYRWRAVANDGTSDALTWSSWCEFTVDVTAPAVVTGLTSSQYPAGVWTQSPTATTDSTKGTFTWTASGGATSYLWGWDGTPSTSTSTASTGSVPVGDGWRTLSVLAVDAAGNRSAVATYTFGGMPAVTSPADGAKTQGFVNLLAATKPTAVPYTNSVTYRYRRSTTEDYVNVPVADVTDPATSLALAAWPNAFTGTATTSTTPLLVWNLAQTLGKIDGTVQVQACFGTSPLTCSLVPSNVTVNANSFGDSFATTDVGPGRVSLLTGNLNISATDASVSAFGSTLSVGRQFNSRTPNLPAEGIFGPGWTPSLPVDEAGSDYTGLTDTKTAVNVNLPDGSAISFGRNATTGAYTALGDDASDGLTLTATGSYGSPGFGPSGLVLADLDGNSTSFTHVDVFTADPTVAVPHKYWVQKASQSTGEPGSAQTTSFTYVAPGQVSQILAPVPAGSTCTNSTSSTTWVGGCRALQLTYDPSKHLSVVTLATTDPSSGAPLFVDLACYGYTAGRLSTVWDPRRGAPGPGNHPIVCDVNPVLATTYSYDNNGRISAVTPAGLQPVTMIYGDLGKLLTVTRTHAAPFGTGSEVTTLQYQNIPAAISDTSKGQYWPDMGASTIATWGQTDAPVTATVIYGPGDNASATDWRDGEVNYLDVNGREVNTASYAGTGSTGWHLSTTEYNATGAVIRSLWAANREEALAPRSGAGLALNLPADTAAAARMLDAQTFFSDDGMDVTDSYGPYHQVTLGDGTVTAARALIHTKYDTNTKADIDAGHPAGPVLHLPVLVTSSASLAGTANPADASVTLTDQRSTRSDYALDANNTEGWKFRTPLRTVTELGITRIIRYDLTTGLPILSQMPSDTAGTGAGSTRTVYWTFGANSVDAACGNKPQWTNLICKTSPVAQPTLPTSMPSDTPKLAGLATTTSTYDYLLRPVSVTETVTAGDGIVRTRTTTSTFEAGGYGERLAQTAITTSGTGLGNAIPTRTSSYDSTTGLPLRVDAAATVELTASATVSSYDDFGRALTYADADGNTATTSYDSQGRVSAIADSKGTRSYTYTSSTEHRGLPTSVTDSTLTGTFTGSYDAGGRLATQSYPNGMTTATNFDETGSPVGLSTTAPDGTTKWFAEAISKSIGGQWRTRAATTSAQIYTYDGVGRLRSVADSVADICVTRSYAFDMNSNRIGSVSYPADASDPTLCQTSTGVTNTNHTYDDADRLMSANLDAGLVYDPFGRTTTLPAADTLGGINPVTLSYYANDLVRSQTQAGHTLTWALDPALRFRSWTDSTGPVTKTNHYNDGSDNPTWIAENSTATNWTRNIGALGGGLAVTVDQAGTKTWQLTNLHGDIIATVPDGDTLTYQEADEYGNPRDNTARRYGWLGSKQRSGDALGGVVLMGVRLYSPLLGRFLQTDPIVGGNENAYVYPPDPVNRFDIDGRASGAKSNVGKYQAAWCALAGAYACYRANKARNWAKDYYRYMMDNLGMPENVADAFMHVIWIARVTNATGGIMARALGRAHEADTDNRTTPADRQRDLMNNDLGSNFSGYDRRSNEAIIKHAWKLFNSGRLNCLSNSGSSVVACGPGTV